MNKSLNELAENYLHPNSTLSVDARIIEIISEKVVQLIKGPKVLEMGFGSDAWTSKVINRFGHTYLVDGSKKLIDHAKEKYKERCTCFCSYFEDFQPKIKFDCVLASLVLEHLDDPVEILRRTKEWVSPDGQIFVMVPNAGSIHRLLGKCLGLLDDITDLNDSDKVVGHKRVYTKSALEKDILEAGLTIKKQHKTLIKFNSNSQMESYSKEQLNALFDLANFLPTQFSANLLYECGVINA